MNELNIESEKWREYEYEDGYIIRIDLPLKVYITDDGQHRVMEQNNVIHYISRGWRQLRWLSHDVQNPVIA